MMNWREMNDEEVLAIAGPIMDNLMQASTEVDHARHVRDFSDRMKEIVTRESFEAQCRDYQARLGLFARRELVGIFRKATDVRVFWRQWYTKSEDEFLAFVHLVERDGRVQVVNASVS